MRLIPSNAEIFVIQFVDRLVFSDGDTWFQSGWCLWMFPVFLWRKTVYILTFHFARLHARVDFNCLIYCGTYCGSINEHWHIWRPQTEYQFLLNGSIIAGWFLWKIGHHEKFKVRILKRVDWLSWWKNNDWPSDSEIWWDGIRYEQRCVSSKQSLSINIDITRALFKFEYTDAEFPM